MCGSRRECVLGPWLQRAQPYSVSLLDVHLAPSGLHPRSQTLQKSLVLGRSSDSPVISGFGSWDRWQQCRPVIGQQNLRNPSSVLHSSSCFHTHNQSPGPRERSSIRCGNSAVQGPPLSSHRAARCPRPRPQALTWRGTRGTPAWGSSGEAWLSPCSQSLMASVITCPCRQAPWNLSLQLIYKGVCLPPVL